MEEIINKPDNQFKDILNDLIDYSKDSEMKSALIKEVCHTRRPTKPAASLNSSIYSSAASSSSSTSSASDSSTSSTLSSPSQGTQSNNDTNGRGGKSNHGQDMDDIEVAKMEDLGKTAKILEHRLAISNELKTATNGVGYVAGSSTHSDKRSISLNGKLPLPSSSASSVSQIGNHHSMQQHQSNLTHQNSTNSTIDTNITNWITINKRDKRRKRPAEQPVLSQHIPGHKGEQEVDWLVNFIESGAAGTNSINSNTTKKITKNIKTQPKRQPNQNMAHDREINSRKSNNKSTIPLIRPLQQQQQQQQQQQPTPPPPQQQQQQQQQQPQSKPTSNPTTTSVPPTQSTPHSNQRKVQAISIDNRPQQSLKQQSHQERSNDRSNECKETSNNRLKAMRNHDQKKEGKKQDEAVVTFAEHIRISDDDVNGQYTFGFFDEQRQQTNSQSKPTKTTTKHNENSPVSNSKLNQNGQKHKLKHPRASLNSEQKRYKFNDNIDANSFNYHQILEFIRNSWESTTKSHRL